MTPVDLDPYQVLGIGRHADAAIVHAAYRLRALERHPDRGGTDGQMRRVAAAYGLLSDAAARAAWDRLHPLDPAPVAGPRSPRPRERPYGGVASHAPPTSPNTRRSPSGARQWVVTITIGATVLVAGAVGGGVGLVLAALGYGTAWQVARLPPDVPYLPLRDVASLVSAAIHACSADPRPT